MSTFELSIAEVRRIAVAAQGLHLRRPAGPIGARQLRDVLRRIGVLQVDFVNVLVPAHYLIPYSRLGAYERKLLDDLVYRRRQFTEQAAHEASIVPIEHWPLLCQRMQSHDRRARALATFMEKHASYVTRVLERVRTEGAVDAENVPVPDDAGAVARDAWGWSLPKAALEGHFHRGTLAVARRRADFARVYDLAERVIPPPHCERPLGGDDAARALVRLAARAVGVGTVSDLADYYRLPVREARRQILQLVSDGELQSVQVENWREPAYLHPDAERPARTNAHALLSPFDPLVWFRPRVARVFGFDYRIEIYVPKAKRRWGYYVLPFLLGDRLAARVDLKADRRSGRLLVLAAYAEAKERDTAVAAALATELRALADWLGLAKVGVARKGNLAPALAAAIAAGRRRVRDSD